MYKLLHIHSITGETTNSSSEMFIVHPPVAEESIGTWARSIGVGVEFMHTAQLLFCCLINQEQYFISPDSKNNSPLFSYLELRLHTFKGADNYDYLKEALDEMPGQDRPPINVNYDWKVGAEHTIEQIKWILMYEEALDSLLAGTVMVSISDRDSNYWDQFEMLEDFGVHWRN